MHCNVTSEPIRMFSFGGVVITGGFKTKKKLIEFVRRVNVYFLAIQAFLGNHFLCKNDFEFVKRVNFFSW